MDPCHPFPFLGSLSLSIAVELEDAFKREKFAIVSVPQACDRWIKIKRPESALNEFVPVEQVIIANLGELFHGRGLHSFPFPLNLSLLCRCPLNLSSFRPPYHPNQPMEVARRCSR